jgi:p-hydroxybenzoate 3-monooxygenase
MKLNRSADRAKGPNLAVADVALLVPGLTAMINRGDHGAADSYSERALRRVRRCTHFSWWMTTILHTQGDGFDGQLQGPSSSG